MYFVNREDAGQQLAQTLSSYKNNKDVIVLGLPRGGVVVAAQIAKALHAPLDIILAHKIGHPYNPEYAIAAISEKGYMLGNPRELQSVGKEWLEKAKAHEKKEMDRRRKDYLKGRPEPNLANKIVILVDDGIATGLTMKVAIQELLNQNPQKIIVAVPVAPQSTANAIQEQVDDVVTVETPEDWNFLGAIGAYYKDFSQTEDDEVIKLLNN